MEMEFEYLCENGEFFVEETEVQRLVEETGMSEDDVMDAISELISEKLETIDIPESDYTVKDAGNNKVDKPTVVDAETRPLENNDNVQKPAQTQETEQKGGKIKGFFNKQAGKWNAMSTKKKVGIGAAAALGTAAIAGGAAYLKHRKNKKEEEMRRRMQESTCFEDYLIGVTISEGDAITIDANDMDFLLEACDYELSEAEIISNVYNILAEEGEVKKSFADSFINLVSKLKIAKKEADANPDDPKKQAAFKRLANKVNKFTSDPEKMRKLKKGGKIAAITAIGGGLAGATIAAGATAHKRKKEIEELKRKQLEECMINYTIDLVDDTIVMSESDMDFLLEACDYTLSEEEIIGNILEGGVIQAGHGPNAADVTKYVDSNLPSTDVKKENKKQQKQDPTTIQAGHGPKAAENTKYANSSVPATTGKEVKYELATVPAASTPAVPPKAEDVALDKHKKEEKHEVATTSNNNKGPVVDTQSGNPTPKVAGGETETTAKTAPKKSMMERIKGASKGKKIAAGALVGGALVGGAIAAGVTAHKRKKELEELKRKQLKECMIELVQEGEYIFMSESDMDLLLEICDYNLTETEILTSIAEAEEVDEYFPGDGIVAVTSDKTMAKIKARQSVDMDEDADDNGMMADVSLAPETKEKLAETEDLLDESEDLLAECEDLLAEGQCEKATKKLNKAKTKLGKAQRTRKEMENLSVTTYGGGYNRLAASRLRKSKDNQDKRVDKLKDKVKKAEAELKQVKKVSESFEDFNLDELISEGLDIIVETDEILDEAFELIEESENLLEAKSVEKAERKLRKAEDKLKKAEEVREQIDRVEKAKQRRESSLKLPFTGIGTGAYNTSTARSINRGRDRQDRRIEKAKEKVAKAKAALALLKSEGYVPASMRINETASLNDYEDIISEAMEALFDTDDVITEAEDLIDEVLAESEELLTEDAIEKAKRKVAKAEKKLERAKRDKETMVDLEDRKLRREVSTKMPFVGIGTGAYNTSVARSVVRGRRRQDKRIQKAEEKLAKAKAALKLLQPKSEAYDYYSETFEGDHLINEAILTDANVNLTEDEMFDLISDNMLSERSIVRLDKQAKRSQAEAKALVVIAREQNDPLYKKLVKCYKQKQAILAQLDSKYGSRAIARVRKNTGKIKGDK